MKKLLILLALFLFAKDMPPAPPVSKKIVIPRECKTIPDMLLFFPPPMEKDFSECRNALFKPSLEKVKKVFKNAKKVEVVKDFSRLYKITTKDGKYFYCNYNLTYCIKGDIFKVENVSRKKR